MTTTPHDTTTLLTEAARALVARDGQRLERLAAISAGWMQTAAEGDAQHRLLMAMAEAAYLLEGEDSEFAIAGDSEGEAE